MWFNKQKFLENASNDAIRTIPALKLRVLDGLEVLDDKVHYQFDGEECVFEVLPEWCDELKQDSLF